MVHLKWILILYEALFGLRINLEKKAIIPVGDVEDSDMLAQELGLLVTCLPITLVFLLVLVTKPARFGIVWRKSSARA